MKKIKLQKSKELITKAIIISTLFVCLVISFFFSSKIEYLLNLRVNYGKNEVSFSKVSSSDFVVSYLDVGQGNCCFVELPNGKCLLVDGGDESYGDKVCDFINNKGYDVIDYMIATHADSDHIGGLVKVLDNFEVRNILRPFQICGTNLVEGSTSAENFKIYEDEDLGEVYEKIMSDTDSNSKISRVDSDIYKEFISKIYTETFGEEDSNVFVFYNGLTISGENFEIEFFSPFVKFKEDKTVYDISKFSSKTKGFATEGYGPTESNDCSAIFLLTVYGYDFLFTGDASFSLTKEGISGEEIDFVDYILKDNDKIERFSDIDVYLVGHHGSKTSSSEQLLSVINPFYAVVSVAKKNSFGHPTKDAINRVNSYMKYDTILMTKDNGNICFFESDDKLVYSVDATAKKEELIISWEHLGTILFFVTSYVIIMVRVKKDW